MTNNEILNEYFIWEENDYTKLNQNNYKLDEKDNCVIMTETKRDSTNKDWRDITNPKLKDKLRKRAWYKANRDKIREQHKIYNQVNKDKVKEYKKNWARDNKEKLKEQKKAYREANKDKIKEQSKFYREINKEKLKLKNKLYNQTNKDKIREQKKVYREVNKDRLNKYVKNRKENNIHYKLSINLRSRLNRALTCNYKSGSAVKDLGCTIDEFKIYLESKFHTGMTWDNWTKDGWHIDHIKPLSSFDLTDRNQLLEACHYTNLQPLWAQDNLTKSDKLI